MIRQHQQREPLQTSLSSKLGNKVTLDASKLLRPAPEKPTGHVNDAHAPPLKFTAKAVESPILVLLESKSSARASISCRQEWNIRQYLRCRCADLGVNVENLYMSLHEQGVRLCHVTMEQMGIDEFDKSIP